MLLGYQEIQCLIDNDINFNNRIFIDYYAHVVTPIHKLIDKTNEIRSGNKIGTTCKGIGPTYMDKYNRIGIRIIDLLNASTTLAHRGLILEVSAQNSLESSTTPDHSSAGSPVISIFFPLTRRSASPPQYHTCL